MAKRKTPRKTGTGKTTNHLRSQGSFKFAINVALLAVLIALLVTLVSEVGTMQLYESRAATQMMGY